MIYYSIMSIMSEILNHYTAEVKCSWNLLEQVCLCYSWIDLIKNFAVLEYELYLWFIYFLNLSVSLCHILGIV